MKKIFKIDSDQTVDLGNDKFIFFSDSVENLLIEKKAKKVKVQNKVFEGCSIAKLSSQDEDLAFYKIKGGTELDFCISGLQNHLEGVPKMIFYKIN